MANYVSKARTVEFQATSRCAIKVKDNYYTLELTEKRIVPDDAEIDLDKEYSILFDSLNAQIDKQMEDVLNAIKK